MILREKNKIEMWLNSYQIVDYELIEDQEYGYIVNVNSNVNLSHKKINQIKVKFNKVKGNFYCNHNELNSLEGCPNIINGDFSCSYNNLKSLKGCPEIINGYFYCSCNFLDYESLQYLPKVVKLNDIDFYDNQKLNNLQYIYSFDKLQEHITEFIDTINQKEKLSNIISVEVKNTKKINKL